MDSLASSLYPGDGHGADIEGAEATMAARRPVPRKDATQSPLRRRLHS